MNLIEILPFVLWPAAVVLMSSFVLLLARSFGYLHQSAPTTVDEIILHHQVTSALQSHAADTILIGDSSCLMDCSSELINRQMDGSRVLNLGTLSYLGFGSFGELANTYSSANHDKLRNVVLLVHPEMLRSVDQSAAIRQSASSVVKDEQKQETRRPFGSQFTAEPSQEPFIYRASVKQIRTRLLRNVLPWPLPGAYGQFYGFDATLDRYLTEHAGTAIDPKPSLIIKRNEVYEIAPSIRQNSRAFKARIPRGVRLFVGITPVPSSSVAGTYRNCHQEMTRTLAELIDADIPLTSLPATLPQQWFASATHLNETGMRYYSKKVALALYPFLSSNPHRRTAALYYSISANVSRERE